VSPKLTLVNLWNPTGLTGRRRGGADVPGRPYSKPLRTFKIHFNPSPFGGAAVSCTGAYEGSPRHTRIRLDVMTLILFAACRVVYLVHTLVVVP
jgi:hypothetical protein